MSKPPNPLEFTPARTFAIICAFYPGIVERFLDGKLTDKQISMLMEEFGFVRYFRDQQGLRYAFSKMQPEDRERLAAGPKPEEQQNPIDLLAWQEFAYRPYGLLGGEGETASTAAPIPGLSPEAAQAICTWWGRGDCPEDVWVTMVPYYERIVATAAADAPG
ncbi:hypothetical protein [Deinococcus hopiensis]|uniref:Uncharacterized protein n=1 Tax=Deinococcus hopiensis KR-140 TaxID=695939 RepID=A0A1W1V771_9DEIO|nr:hypothetical protein [Deinococcus hopiensis]SMB89208.1 hypothetical protein SAMN00790413_00310 [Deinococcus hopiensis KR-140]